MRRTIALLIAAAILLILACTDHGAEDRKPFPAESYLPNEIGMWWEYETIVGRIHQDYVETVTVRVMDTVTLSNGAPAKIWVAFRSEKLDTTFVYSTADSAVVFFIYPYWDTLAVEEKYFFPMKTGIIWCNGRSTDSFYVAGEDTLEITPADTGVAFRLERRLHGPCWQEINVWFMPRLGEVARQTMFACNSIPFWTKKRLLAYGRD